MANFKRKIQARLREAGWEKLKGRGKGSHEMWARKNGTGKKTTVPRNIDDRNMANDILDRIGLGRPF